MVKQGERNERELGFLPGLDTPPSFFEPLPEDELAAWDGRAGEVV
jgi:hypothetical protein